MENIYKIVIKENNLIKTLFHGVNRTRILPINSWLKADKKIRKDGSNGKEYLTGFHCFKSKEKAIKFMNRFRTNKNRIIVECKAKGLRQKPTNQNVFLADEIYINKEVKI